MAWAITIGVHGEREMIAKGATFTRTCIYCGKEFQANSPSGKVCQEPECQARFWRDKRDRKNAAKRARSNEAYRENSAIRTSAERRFKKTQKDFAEILKQAEEKGMTYGQYVGKYERDSKL